MSDLTYIVFPKDYQPTETQITNVFNRNLQFLGAVRWGYEATTKQLAVEINTENYVRLYNKNINFASMIEQWKRDGAKEHNLISFTPDESALRSVVDVTEVIDRNENSRQAAYHRYMAAREAEGRLRMQRQEFIDRIRFFGDNAPDAVKWMLAGLVLCGAPYLGYKTYRTIESINVESRQDTIDRVLRDPMGAPLETLRGDMNKAEDAAEPGEIVEATESKTSRRIMDASDRRANTR